jgi:hypothetical protein
MPRVLREQDSSLKTYPPKEVPTGTTVGECRTKFRHDMSITPEMACIIRGEAVSDDHRLAETDVAYFKKGSKKRGFQ